MTTEPSGRKRAGPPGGVVALVAASALALGAWWLVDRAREGRLDAELAAFRDAELPAAGAPVDSTLAGLGAELFRRRCSACHAITGESRVGPDLAGVTERRTLPWIEAMILRPDSMTRTDPDARALREAYPVQMLVTGEMDPARARAVIEFLRQVDGR